MTDLRFMIVNSNLQHAQQIIHELQNRVSFDVYQDTKEKNIWGLLDGGKDDIYVYDRCGRLAYYIPFPLSIMNNEEGSLVTSAILATYYRSPCGTTCEKNSSTLEDFLNNVDRTESPVDTTTEEVSMTTELHQEMLPSNQTDDVSDFLPTNTSSVEETIETKANHSAHFGDVDYPTYDETLEEYDNNNETSPKHDHAFFNTLYSLFFNADTPEPPLNTNETLSANASSNEFAEGNNIFTPLNISEHDIPESHNNNNTEMSPEIETTTIPTQKPKPDRCAEADPSVCKNWSKKRLLRAHNCCSSIDSEDESRNQLRFCKNFGKKRCKKIKTILKCCIKTALFEVTTAITVEEDVTATTTDAVTDVNDVVCCRDADEGKLCRVSEETTCKLGEYVQESVPQIEESPMEERIM